MEIASKEATTKYFIPVTWEVSDYVEVQAKSLKEAYEYVKDNLDEIPLGTEPEYIDGSYRIESNPYEEFTSYQDGLVCIDFDCDENLSQYTDSMLFPTTSNSGDSIASGRFSFKGEELDINLDVCGETQITFKGEVYKNILDYPKELLMLMHDNPNKWELNEDVVVGSNNWFEYTMSNGDGEVYEKDLSKATEQDILNDMTAIARQYFNM